MLLRRPLTLVSHKKPSGAVVSSSSLHPSRRSCGSSTGMSLIFLTGLLSGGSLMYVLLLVRMTATASNSVAGAAIAPQQSTADLLLAQFTGLSAVDTATNRWTPAMTTTSKLRRRTSTDNTNNNNNNNLWRPIHVFTGASSTATKAQLSPPPKKGWRAQVHQDEIVMDLLGSTGYFIDLAANDALDWSNTAALEQHGWNGLCIEPNPTYWYGLTTQRQCTVIGALVGGPTVEQVNVKFRGVFGGIVGRMDDKLANRKREPQAPAEVRYTAPLTDLLSQFDVPAVIDYLSLDVEGAEYLIMQHFPFDRYTIQLLTIERPTDELKTLLTMHGYLMLKELSWWGETLWAHGSTGLTPTHPSIVKIPFEGKN